MLQMLHYGIPQILIDKLNAFTNDPNFTDLTFELNLLNILSNFTYTSNNYISVNKIFSIIIFFLFLIYNLLNKNKK